MAASQESVQNRVACRLNLVCSLFAAAVAWPLARPATELAPLSHRLMNGFFFVHGLDTGKIS